METYAMLLIYFVKMRQEERHPSLCCELRFFFFFRYSYFAHDV